MKTLKQGFNQAKRAAEEKQEAIDDYNRNEVFETPEGVDYIQLTGNNIVVRLFKENYIKAVEVLPGGDVMYDAYMHQIDGRVKQTDPAKWIDSPLPYIHAGVVIAISPAAKAHFEKEKQDIEAVSSELAAKYKTIQVGDIVDLTSFNFNDLRYYYNKQERDFLKNPEEARVIHFDGCVKIHPSYVDGVVTDVESYMTAMSPYAQYVDWENECDSCKEGGKCEHDHDTK